MDVVDYSAKEHAEIIAKALDLLRFPHHCQLIGKTKETLVKYRWAKGDLLDAARTYIAARLPLYCQLQTMYLKDPIMGYVICPLVMRDIRLYFKFVLSRADREADERLLVDAHDPEYPCPGEKK